MYLVIGNRLIISNKPIGKIDIVPILVIFLLEFEWNSMLGDVRVSARLLIDSLMSLFIISLTIRVGRTVASVFFGCKSVRASGGRDAVGLSQLSWPYLSCMSLRYDWAVILGRSQVSAIILIHCVVCSVYHVKFRVWLFKRHFSSV